MPAFSFERLSPPARRDPTTPLPEKQPSLIVQLLGRLTGARTWRGKEDLGSQPKPSD